MNEPRVSIDNLTLVGDKAGDIEQLLMSTPYVIEKSLNKRGPYRWRYPCIDGTLIQLQGLYPKTPCVRIEFNPNSSLKVGTITELHRILGNIKYPKITRLDIAIDYVDVDLSQVVWLDNAKRKRNNFYSRRGVLETTYIGSRNSDVSYRIYDKRREEMERRQKEKRRKRRGIPVQTEPPPPLPKSWWRVEYQGRKSIPRDLTAYNPFSELDMLLPPVTYPQQMKLQEKAMIDRLMSHPEDWNQLSRGSQRKYQDKVKELSTSSIPSPAHVFDRNKHHLQAVLDTILSCCAISHIG